MLCTTATNTSNTIRYDTIRCDTIRSYFNVRSKADISQLNLPHKPTTKSGKIVKSDMLRSIGKQSGESVESVLKNRKKTTVGRIYRKGRF